MPDAVGLPCGRWYADGASPKKSIICNRADATSALILIKPETEVVRGACVSRGRLLLQETLLPNRVPIERARRGPVLRHSILK
jgi:hypothetical protein